MFVTFHYFAHNETHYKYIFCFLTAFLHVPSNMLQGTLTMTRSWTIYFLGVGIAVIIIVLLIVTFFPCTDCYKSEVSSDRHPASCSGNVRWGGAGGYSSTAPADVHSTVLGTGFSSEVRVDHVSNHSLPYTLYPTHVPEAQGFQGYVPRDTPNSALNPTGYRNEHFNVLGSEGSSVQVDPPPPYTTNWG